MDDEQQQTNRASWWARSKAWIIGAGALAAAGLAVLSLGDRLFPPDLEDVARIESVDLIGQTSLKEFARKGFGVEFPLGPAPAAAPGEAAVFAAVESAQPMASAVATPSDEPGDPSTPGSPSTDEPIPPTTQPPTMPPTSPEVTSPPAAEDLKLWTPPDAYLQTMLSDPVIEAYGFTENEVKTTYFVAVEPSGAEGEELAPEEAVARVAAALDAVETTTDDTGAFDPVGWTVAVNLTLEGLADVPLLLSWSLDGVDVPEEWAAEKVTYRVVAGTPRDVGSAEIWVPQLKTAGEYNVNVKLKLASDGATIAHGPPLSISIP